MHKTPLFQLVFITLGHFWAILEMVSKVYEGWKSERPSNPKIVVEPNKYLCSDDSVEDNAFLQ